MMKKHSLETSLLNLISIGTLVTISFYILISHMAAFLVQSYKACILPALLVTIIFAALVAFRLFEIKVKTDKYQIIALVCAFVLALNMAMRDQALGSPDRGHIAFTNSVFFNDIYPPIYPTGPEFSMSFYHYGVNLLASTIRLITGFDIWMTLSTQIFMGAFLCFTSLFALFNFFIRSSAFALLFSLITYLYTSPLNSIEYFIKELPKFFGANLSNVLRDWIMMSWTSVSHITSQLRLLGQNIGLPLVFTLILILCLFYKNYKEANKAPYQWSILLLSFFLYFCYPTYWYPLCAGFGAFFVLTMIVEKKVNMDFVFVLVLLYLGKVICFGSAHTSFDGINIMKFAPNLEWTHWGKSYIRYFYDMDYLRQLKAVRDEAFLANMPQIPLFSSISLREFGLSTLAALVLAALAFLKEKKLKIEQAIFFMGGAAFCLPFFFKFILRSVETIRFLFVAKVFFLIFALICIYYLYQKLLEKKTFIYSVTLPLLIILLPGFLFTFPNPDFAILINRVATQDQRALTLALEKIHKSNEIVLSTDFMDQVLDISSMAGFYGVKGQFYKLDRITRETAMKTMNPALLNELNVDYVLVHNKAQIDDEAKAKLADTNLFEEVLSLAKTQKQYKLFKFLAKGQDFVNDSYAWVIGYQVGVTSKFVPIKGPGERVFSSKSRIAMQNMLPEVKKQIGAQNPIVAVWLKEYAIAI